ncbi:hypothetical protein BKN38_01505 [Helicobacter sp. CLO-3]|uniref:HAMP domain-containing histidine kinase n=1 Tax=unclassified Helicobacter TaxID=2593540 RepID=UPI000804E2B9|nr:MULTISPECIES: HAMP domain-containing histidine kinase [unclassified Helicobacter]OBV29779.1 hypothetical protein BA723_00305 [Helicobacter sp. CLO-3]OHU85233.1 hypothetical protein BKN38_01505 [Helicobacter sp. CLO-3]
MTQFDIAMMTKYLKNKGYNLDELSQMSSEKLTELYEETVRNFIYEAQDIIRANSDFREEKKQAAFITPEVISIVAQQPSKLYEVIDNYIDSYTPDDIAHTFFSAIPHAKLNKLKKMVRIKVRELQEVWLLEIRKNIASLPKEEIETLMKYYTDNKENLQMIKSIYEKSSDSAYLDEIRTIANMKLTMIQEYMPEELERNYKTYYDNSPEKLEIIQEITKLSETYTKKSLLSNSITELQEILKEVREKDEQKRAEDEKMHAYFDIFKSALHDPDDQAFVDACLEAASALPRQKFQELAIILSKHYKTFRQRFKDVTKEFGDIQNLQIVF